LTATKVVLNKMIFNLSQTPTLTKDIKHNLKNDHNRFYMNKKIIQK